MYITHKLAIIAALVSYLFGFTPVWCDWCGEMYHPAEVTTCAACGAELCPYCATVHVCEV